MTAFGSDIRVSLRRLLHRPAFALTAVLVLGLGIGASAVVLSLARVVVLQPLPYGAPDQLVLLWNAREPGETTWLSAQEVVSYQRDAATLQDVAAYATSTASLTDGEGATANFTTNFYGRVTQTIDRRRTVDAGHQLGWRGRETTTPHAVGCCFAHDGVLLSWRDSGRGRQRSAARHQSRAPLPGWFQTPPARARNCRWG